LALSEEDNPVIIEYKVVESSELITQSLYYLSWIKDHKGDFQVLVNQHLSKNVEIDWSDVRIICIAPGYKKYDLHAVQMMGANIELWQYRLFENDSLYLEEIFRKSTILYTEDYAKDVNKNPIMVAAGKKAALTRKTGIYSFDEHIKNLETKLKDLVLDINEFILSLNEDVEMVPKKHYIAYKVAQNFVCMKSEKNKIVLYLKLNPTEFKNLPSNARDMTEKGHWGTGDLELTIQDKEEFESAKEYIRFAFERVGG
jgi:predicted transport protein